MVKRRWVRRTLGLGLLAGAAYALWRAIEANRTTSDTEWEPQPFPFPPQPRSDRNDGDDEDGGDRRNAPGDRDPEGVTPVRASSDPAPFVEPTDGTCPATHAVKGKLTSKIFHVPGGQSYDRTVPDRCYVDAAAAEADGLRAAKR